MQLPVYKKKLKEKLKICQEPGCGKEFWGHPIAKYCEFHRDITHRKRKRKPNVFKASVGEDNLVFDHSFSLPTDVEFACALEGCKQKFYVRVLPKQTVYPKYCLEHRNEFKRKNFVRTKKVVG